MKALILATIFANIAFGTVANAGLMIDATQGPIKITVDGR
jgi:hypothetical protein